MGVQQIEQVFPVTVAVQFGPILKELLQLNVTRSAASRFDQRLRNRCDLVMPEKRVSQRGFLLRRIEHGFFTITAEGRENVCDQFRTIARQHAERVSWLISQVRSLERKLKVLGLFGRTRCIQIAASKKSGRERIGPRKGW